VATVVVGSVGFGFRAGIDLGLSSCLKIYSSVS